MKKAIMKTKLIISMVLLFAICTGCKKPTECKVSHWPDSDVTISWDGTNDVKTMKRYFDCHDSALFNNYKKKVEVCGYIKKYVNSSRYVNSLAICSDTIMTSDNYIILDYLDGAPIPTYDSTCMSKLTGLIAPPYWFDECCNNLLLLIQSIEKL